MCLKSSLVSQQVWGNALFSKPETCIWIQTWHPYTGNPNSETSGDSQNTLLHCGDVSAAWQDMYWIQLCLLVWQVGGNMQPDKNDLELNDLQLKIILVRLILGCKACFCQCLKFLLFAWCLNYWQKRESILVQSRFNLWQVRGILVSFGVECWGFREFFSDCETQMSQSFTKTSILNPQHSTSKPKSLTMPIPGPY